MLNRVLLSACAVVALGSAAGLAQSSPPPATPTAPGTSTTSPPSTGVSDPSGSAGTVAPPVPAPTASPSAGAATGAAQTGTSTAPAMQDRPAASQTVPGPSGSTTSTATTSGAGSTGAQTTSPGSGQLSFYKPQDSDMTASKLKGVDTYNQQNETVGEIEDVILDANRAVKAYILGVGGFLGVGQRFIALEPGSVTLQRQEGGDYRAVVNATKDALQSAPEFKYEGNFKQ